MTERRTSLSLGARLTLGIAALLLVGGLVMAVATLAYGRAAAREAFDRLLVGAANDIAASVSVEGGRVSVDLPVSAFELLALAPDDRIAYQVRDIDGTVLTGYDTLPQPPNAADPFYDASFAGEEARFIRVSRRFAERAVSGTVDIIVGQTIRARRELAYEITRNALAGLAIGGVAMIVLALIAVRSALRPLDSLAEALAARDPQDLTPLDPRVPRDIAPMVDAMNGFMGRLDRQFDAMRNLISDTAHQLRTPVAALRAQADLALHDTDAERRDRIVARIHQRSVSLGRLLDQMLSRAMVVHRIDSVRREAVDLRDIALDVIETGDHAMIAPGAEVRLQIGEDPIIVQADALSLREAFRNLFTNALHHGQAPVTIGADLHAGTAHLWVRDSGPGPTPEVVAELGQRFLRSAASAGRTSGLGLAIAQAVAEAFGGKVDMAPTPEGFRVALVLPVSTRSM
ncbi:MAG: sensor histidine kinase N-terminal domain-containing protein [Paracoccaceae bacterium]